MNICKYAAIHASPSNKSTVQCYNFQLVIKCVNLWVKFIIRRKNPTLREICVMFRQRRSTLYTQHHNNIFNA